MRRLAVDDNDLVLIAWVTNQGQANGASTLRVGNNTQARDSHIFTSITTADGLPSNDVRDVAFAPSGAMWFATLSGVARDDGNGNVDVFRTGDGLPSNTVRQIAIDEVTVGGVVREVAWAATSGGLARIDAAVPSVIAITAADGPPSNDLVAITIDDQHRKYVGAANVNQQQQSTVFRYDGL